MKRWGLVVDARQTSNGEMQPHAVRRPYAQLPADTGGRGAPYRFMP